jgi:alkylation response protein AidB-like acyl-CoA dehydrogenase
MARNLTQELTRSGLKLLGRFARSELTDNPNLRKASEKAIFEITRAGFKIGAVVSRPFAAVGQIGKAARPEKAKSGSLFDLNPTEEQSMIRDEMRKFAAGRLRPAAMEADKNCTAPAELLAESAGLGTALMNIPEEMGGAATERAVVTQALIAEALGHGDMGLAVACLAPAGVAAALSEWGTAEQQAKYLTAFAEETPPAASIALAEPRPLFDPFVLQTKARKEGADYVLEGVKTLVPLAAQAELFLVAAQTDSGPAMFIVESSTTGLSLEADPGMGVRAAGLGRLKLENARIPAANRLGGEEIFPYADLVHRSRLAWCALAVGTAQAALDYVIPYVNDRVAFGEPVSHRQSVAFAVANIGIETDGMRLLTWRAATRAERGQSFAKEAAWARKACVDHGMRIGSEGVQLLGGHGYTKEHPVERWYRDLRAVGVMEGGLML